jgi:hypothetical protein
MPRLAANVIGARSRFQEVLGHMDRKREEKRAQSGFIEEINRLSACFRMRTSFTASENLNS